ncbi:MAG: hypothetical protein LBP76_11835 [Treponema sp.]|jgi:hypothetical protein|nr:hypothetical protein [Treponema sp.]
MKKKKYIVFILSALAVVFLFLVIKYPGIFAGILYPKVEFSIWAEKTWAEEKDNDEHKLRMKIEVWGEQYTTFLSYPRFAIAAERPYKRIYIKEILYEWEGNSRLYCTDLSFQGHWDYVESNKLYYYVTKRLPKINLGKIFHDKKPGDVFRLQWIITYQCDDDPEWTEVSECTVRAVEGTLRIPIPMFVGV